MEELNIYVLLCVLVMSLCSCDLHVMSLNNTLNSSRLTVAQLTQHHGKTSTCFTARLFLLMILTMQIHDIHDASSHWLATSTYWEYSYVQYIHTYIHTYQANHSCPCYILDDSKNFQFQKGE